MRYFRQLQNRKVFSLADVTALTGNINTAKSILQRYQKDGLIEKVRRNTYVAMDEPYGAPAANKYEIGCFAIENSCLVLHSAFEIYGAGNQVYNVVYLSAPTKFSSFEYDAIRYEYAPCKNGMRQEYAPGVIATTPEQTIADAIFYLGKQIGLEELIQCLGDLSDINEQELVNALANKNQKTIFNRCGYLLSTYANGIFSLDNVLSYCASHLGKKPVYLFPDRPSKCREYNAQWGMYTAKMTDMHNQEDIYAFI